MVEFGNAEEWEGSHSQSVAAAERLRIYVLAHQVVKMSILSTITKLQLKTSVLL